MKRTLVPYVVQPQEVAALGPEAMVAEAAALMAERKIGALAVITGGRLSHIFTERDVLTRVVAAGRDPATTTLAEVATPDPDTLPPTAEAAQALEKMRERRYRHMPVVEGDRLIAMVSIRDLHEAALNLLQDEVKQREAMLFGSPDGLA